MALNRLQVRGYRSVRDLTISLGRVNIITGANGTGKSNLYQALMLVARAAQGQFARAVAEEGGTPSLLWAGGERIRYIRKRSAKRFELIIEDDVFSFSFTAGLPKPSALPPGESLFRMDPEVKAEKLFLMASHKPVLMLDRQGPSTWLRNADGRMDEYALELLKYESVLPQIVDPHRYPEVNMVRQALLGWRFYHQFRTDSHSPLRHPQIGAQTNVLSHDGADLAAALETVREIGNQEMLERVISEAFRGARLRIEARETLFSIYLDVPGLRRPLGVREFSDGQLRFLCLCAALLSPRPASFIALNEPETSLHPDLYQSLARLIAQAARESQIWVATHSRNLADQIGEQCNTKPMELTLVEGETWLAGKSGTPRRPYKTKRDA